MTVKMQQIALNLQEERPGMATLWPRKLLEVEARRMQKSTRPRRSQFQNWKALRLNWAVPASTILARRDPMLRLIASTVLEVAANAIGLLVADWLLPGFSMDLFGFIIVVAIFTVAKFVLGPLIFKLSHQYVQVLSGGVALVTTFVGLLITTLLTKGLVIVGIDTWILATLIVWLCGVLAALVLPMFLFKSILSNRAEKPPRA
jgi:putative membrane protein